MLASYKNMGPRFERIPLEAFKLLGGRDMVLLGTILILYKHMVTVLQKWDSWDPALAQLDQPAFDYSEDVPTAVAVKRSELPMLACA